MDIFLEILKYVSGTIVAVSPIVMYEKRKNAQKRRSKVHQRKG